MDRRTVLAIALSLGIYYLFYGLIYPRLYPTPPEELVEVAPAPAPAPPVAPVAAPVPEVALERFPFAACGGTGEITTDGGRLVGVTLDDHTGPYKVVPLYAWVWGRITGSMSGPWRPYGGQDEVGPAEVLSDKAAGLVAGVGEVAWIPMSVAPSSASAFELTGRSAEGVEVRGRLAEKAQGEVCTLEWVVTWTNAGSAPVSAERWVGVLDHVNASSSRYEQARQPTAVVDGSLNYGGSHGYGACGMSQGTALSDEQRSVPIEGPVGWFGSSDRYFGLYVVPRSGAEGGLLRFQRLGEGDEALDGAVVAYGGALAPGATEVRSYEVYVGPNHEPSLRKVEPALARAIDLGWTAFFGVPLVMALRLFHGWVGNWGLAIILLTFAVKLLFFPLTQRSFRAMQRMQLIQPELTEIREKYKDDPAEQQRRTLEVMTRHNANPVSGCLPQFLQMPVWFALFQVLLTSVDLYHTEFLYLKDLTAPDPYMILPVAITILMTVQQALTPTTNMDPAQQQVMRVIPLVFGFMFFAFPSGLAIYNLVNMALTIVQQWLIRRTTPPPPPLDTPAPTASGGAAST